MDYDGTPFRVPAIMKKLLFIIFILPVTLLAQRDCEPFGSKVFDLIVSAKSELKNEFIDLIEYQSYVDRLTMDDSKKEDLKEHAMNSYMSLKKNYYNECNRIIEFYNDLKEDGYTFNYQYCTHKANPKYPGIGFIELFYLAERKGKITDDSISFECIYTNGGWRIIDGFYQLNP